ncbi:MAG: DUF1800 domain-containing protein [Bacteroidia bacterium]|nr:DUF1800 domain-containing protein [Bacteroidia bacterium]
MSEQRKINHLLWRAAFGPVVPLHISNKRSLADWQNELTNKNNPLFYLDFSDKAIAELQKKSGMESVERLGNKLIRKLTFIGTNHYWYLTMVNSKNDLHERMTLFWAGLFACRNLLAHPAEDYINTIREHALGKFPALLSAISKHPSMLAFLNNQQNRKEHPNENFAREVMELFTLGRGNYTEHDIREAARAFTGWGSDKNGNFVFRENIHDTGEKEFFGQKGNFNGDDILRMITERNQCARYITRKIYAHFVNDVIDEKRVEMLSEKFYHSGYDIATMMKEIFTSDWFYDEDQMGAKIKQPLVLLVNLSRNFKIRFADHASALKIQRVLGQVLLLPPNVAGWPEGKNWIDSSTLMYRLNLPSLLLAASDSPLKPKEEFDAQIVNAEESTENPDEKRRIKIFSDKEYFSGAFGSMPESQVHASLVNLLIQTNNADEVLKQLNESGKNDPVSAALFLMSLPEFQLS